MRFGDLPVVILEHERARAMQHTLTPAGDRGRVLLARDPEATGLDATKTHARIVEESGEHADRVRPAADARDDHVRKTPRAFEVLCARLAADHRLQLADDGGIGMRTD